MVVYGLEWMVFYAGHQQPWMLQWISQAVFLSMILLRATSRLSDNRIFSQKRTRQTGWGITHAKIYKKHKKKPTRMMTKSVGIKFCHNSKALELKLTDSIWDKIWRYEILVTCWWCMGSMWWHLSSLTLSKTKMV